MPTFTIPIDPLLQEAMIPRAPLAQVDGHPRGGSEGPDAEGGHIGSSSDEDDEDLRSPHANKRPRLAINENNATTNSLNPALQNHSSVVAPTPTSLRQYAQSLILLKKLSNNSQQELHRYTTGSSTEREVMSFALNLEIRDSLRIISDAVVSSSVHQDLATNIKAYTAAAFFSPFIRYYAPPSNSARSKDLQKSILKQLVDFGVPHIPPTSDTAGTGKVLGTIGGELTNLRSTVKEELSKRKEGEPASDIGSFSSRLMRNTPLKVTLEHYGRIAMLSREYSNWEARPPELKKAKYWEWVDQALDRVRKQQMTDPKGVETYFKGLMANDEVKFSKAIVHVVDANERDEWQKKVESATSDLA